MDKPIQPAPCQCLPDHVISAVAEVADQRGGGFDETLTFLVLLGLERHSIGETQQEGGVLRGIYNRVAAFFHPAPDTPPKEGEPEPQNNEWAAFLPEVSYKEGGGGGATGGGLPSPAVYAVGQSVTVVEGGHSGKVITCGKDDADEWVYQVRLSHGGVMVLKGDALRGGV